MHFLELGLVIEGFQMRRATGHAEKYHSFGLWGYAQIGRQVRGPSA
jgi:hypothetical protein